MGAGGCAAISQLVTLQAASAEARGRYQQLASAGAPVDAFIEEFVRACPPPLAALVREELAELPAPLVAQIIDAWKLASEAGKTFRMQSVRPERPMEFARERRVRVAIDMDETGVTFALSHVPGRHASWYQPAARAA